MERTQENRTENNVKHTAANVGVLGRCDDLLSLSMWLNLESLRGTHP